jgi:hypothetical protein
VVDAVGSAELFVLTTYLLEELKRGPVKFFMGLFIKNELHSARKARLNRWRIISVPGLLNQLVARILFPEVEQDLGGFFGHKLDVTRASSMEVLRPFLGGVSTDVVAMDFTLSEYGYEALRIACDLVDDPVWKVQRENFLRSIARPTLVLPNGVCLQQEFDGRLASGVYQTSQFNTIFRRILETAARSSVRLPDTDMLICGDNALQVDETPLEAYQSFGYELKVQPRGEFLGYTWADEGAKIVPLKVTNLEKPLAKLGHHWADHLYVYEVYQSYVNWWRDPVARSHLATISYALGFTEDEFRGHLEWLKSRYLE